MPETTTAACPRCGNPILAGTRFCSQCGVDVSGPQGGLTTVNVPMPVSQADLAQAEMLEFLRQATIGDYDILGELGRGGMATVYLAHDIALDRRVAIKIMNPQMLSGEGMVDRFKREARTAAALSHPNIIPIYVVRETPRILYFVMKFVQGRGLDAIIREKGALPIGMVQAILSQVGSALGYAHRRGVVHRDIKPANIMIDDEGFAVVTDFGIAKVAETRGLTMTGATVGTPHYMSPEQCSAKTITGASDQYSLGIVAYEMLSGKPPFAGDSIMEIMKAHFFDPPPPLAETRPDCPAPLAAVIMRMLEKSAENRWPTLEEAVSAIGAKTLTHDDPIRHQLVELAKSVTNLRPLPKFSTPVSMPMGRRPAPGEISSAETVRMATPAPAGRPSASKPKPRPSRLSWVVTAVVVLGAGGWFGAQALKPKPPVQPARDSVSTPAQVVPPPAQTAAVTDSAARPDSTPAPPRRQETRRTTPPVERRRVEPPPAPPSGGGSGTIKLGTRSDAPAVLFINGDAQGAISGLASWPARAGQVRLEIRAQGCRSWDSTVTVSAGQETRVGYRSPTCSP